MTFHMMSNCVGTHCNVTGGYMSLHPDVLQAKHQAFYQLYVAVTSGHVTRSQAGKESVIGMRAMWDYWV